MSNMFFCNNLQEKYLKYNSSNNSTFNRMLNLSYSSNGYKPRYILFTNIVNTMY